MLRNSILILVTAVCALAAPSDCTDGTLADYFGLPAEGCRLGTRVVSAFELLPLTDGSSAIDPDVIDVHPMSAGRTGSLLFTLGISAMDGNVLESFFKLTVTPDTVAPEQVRLELNGASTISDAVVLGIAELCTGGILNTCFGPSDFLLTTAAGPLSAAAITGPGSFDVGQNFVVDAGLAGSASLPSAQLTFTAVPEPGTAAILATGLGCLLLLRRRRTH